MSLQYELSTQLTSLTTLLKDEETVQRWKKKSSRNRDRIASQAAHSQNLGRNVQKSGHERGPLHLVPHVDECV